MVNYKHIEQFEDWWNTYVEPYGEIDKKSLAVWAYMAGASLERVRSYKIKTTEEADSLVNCLDAYQEWEQENKIVGRREIWFTAWKEAINYKYERDKEQQ